MTEWYAEWQELERKEIEAEAQLLFAFNSSKYNYAEMAEYCSTKKGKSFLGLPTTLVTDVESA